MQQEARSVLRSHLVVYAGAMAAGFVVMALEMLGSRYLNPYFGGGIFTWSALISTALGGLALGYFIGGRLVDRYPSPLLLAALFAAAAVWLVLLPAAADPLLSAVFDWIGDVRYGSLAGAWCLLFVPYILLGAYTPFAVRLVLADTASSGTVSGRIYGLSTVGSILGTLLTTFLLIPSFGTRAITFGLAALTILIALALALLRRVRASSSARSTAGIALLLALVAVAAPLAANERFSRQALLLLPDGLVEEIETAYHRIFIVKRGSDMVLTFRRQERSYTESVMSLVDEDRLPVLYTQALTAGLLYVDRPRSMLMVGLGGGTTTRYLERFVPSLAISVVELDPGVIAAAAKYFGVSESDRYKIYEGDGRVFLRRHDERFDLIVVDAFRGGYIPFHLLTREFYQLARSRLAPGGCLVLNLHGGTRLFQSSLATVAGVFSAVHAYRAGGNVVLVAHDGPELTPDQLATRAAELQAEYGFRHSLEEIFSWRIEIQPRSDVELLTDDFAPANLYESIEVD